MDDRVERGPRRLGQKATRRHGPSAVILAAGTASRFGGRKQLAEIGGKTLVHRVLVALPMEELQEVVVVLGHGAHEVAAAIGPREDVKLVVNSEYQRGMGSSIKAGILALAKGSEGVMLLLGDQPFVSKPLLRRMLAAFGTKGSRQGIVAASHKGVVGPPVIFSREYFEELLQLRGDQGAKSVIERHPDSVKLVKVRSKKTLTDIDTRRELKAAQRLFEA